jgi:hypothetical protein
MIKPPVVASPEEDPPNEPTEIRKELRAESVAERPELRANSSRRNAKPASSGVGLVIACELGLETGAGFAELDSASVGLALSNTRPPMFRTHWAFGSGLSSALLQSIQPGRVSFGPKILERVE